METVSPHPSPQPRKKNFAFAANTKRAEAAFSPPPIEKCEINSSHGGGRQSCLKQQPNERFSGSPLVSESVG